MITQTQIQNTIETDYSKAFSILEQKIYAVLQTYSNVERGSGHFSQITTVLLDEARLVVLKHLQLDESNYTVIFCSPWHAEKLQANLKTSRIYNLSSSNIGLPIGLKVLAIKKKDLPNGIPPHLGGGTIKLVSTNSIVLADIPERFEPGTPNVIGAIMFACALQIINNMGRNPFQDETEHYQAPTIDDLLYNDNFLRYIGKQLLQLLQETMVGSKTIVPVSGKGQTYINLDNAASTPAFLPVWRTAFNALGLPVYMRHSLIEEAKQVCSSFFNAPQLKYETIFCTNTTEAINIAVQNFESKNEMEVQPVILNTILEHHSNELPWRFSRKAKLVRIPIDNNGFFNLDELKQILINYNVKHLHGQQRVRILAINGASNVLGSFNDINAITKLAHQYNARILVDGAQLIAHRKIDILNDDIDFLAFSGHKMYAPFGSGGLIARKELINLSKEEYTLIKSSGEENVIGIAAMAKSMLLLQNVGMDTIQNEELNLTKYALHNLSKINGVTLFGLTNTESIDFTRKGAIIAFKVKGVPHNLVAKELAEKGGIGVRTGCFCAHLMVKQLMGISAFRGKAAELFLTLFPGINTAALPGIVRISMGVENTKNDIDHFVSIINQIATTQRSAFTKFTEFMQNGMMKLPKTIEKKTIDKWIDERVDSVFN